MIFEGLPVTFEKRKRQRRVRLAYRNGALSVSGPWWVSQHDLLLFLEQHRDWVINTKAKVNHRSEELLSNHGNPLQDVLYLGKAYRLHWEVDEAIPEGSLHVDIQEEVFCFRGGFSIDWDELSEEQHEEISRLIQRWLRNKASEVLPDRVSSITGQHEFNFQRLFIRSQKTKWGTCSSKGNISLNWKLIQCPEYVIDYLIIHECCHLLEMNHSPAYWKWVEHYYPEYQKSEQWLKRYGSVVFSNY